MKRFNCQRVVSALIGGLALFGLGGCASEEEAAAAIQSNLVVSPDLVISQVYGAGGNSGALRNADYVELFNRSSAAVSLNGKTIQYASDTGVFRTTSGLFALPDVSLPAGGYFLVRMTATGATGAALPTPDATALPVVTLASSNGKLALVNSTALLDACGSVAVPCADGAWIDLVGYGAASQAETAPTGPGSIILALLRNGGGCSDTGNNAADFAAATPAPRNSATAVNLCTAAVDAGAADLGVVEDAGTDAGSPDVDLGTPDVDAGTPIVDAGTPIVDAGTPIIDAGTPIVDAGTPVVDAGTPAIDAGSPVVDAGTPGVDAGSPVVDAGTPDVDAGTADEDMGVTDEDMGISPVDAGSRDLGTPSADLGARDLGTTAPPSTRDDGGCSCSTPGTAGSSGGAAWALLALAALIPLARRRRR